MLSKLSVKERVQNETEETKKNESRGCKTH